MQPNGNDRQGITFARMFNRYWRSYPWYFQLFQLIILIGVMLSFFGGVLTLLLVPKLTGHSISEIATLTRDSPESLRYAAWLMQAISSFGLFVLVPVLFAYATHPRPAAYLGLRKPGSPIHMLLVILLILGLMPLEMSIQSLIQKLQWGADIQAAEQKSQTLMSGMTNVSSGSDYFILLLVVAVLPAIGEELFFRSVFMRFAAKRFTSMWPPLFISSVMFALFHGSFFGFTPILIAGMALGFIYYRTGSAWMNMLGHFVNNAASVTMLYIANSNPRWMQIMETNEVPAWAIALGLAAAFAGLYGLQQWGTPLPPGWTEDYAPEELAAEQSTNL